MAAHGSTPRHFPWILPFSLRWRDSLLPIKNLGKRRAETAEKPIEFDLGFTDPETAPLRPRGQKPRACSLGMNPHSRSSEHRTVPCCLEARGLNGEIAGRPVYLLCGAIMRAIVRPAQGAGGGAACPALVFGVQDQQLG